MRVVVLLVLLLVPVSARGAEPPGKAEFEEARRLFDAGRPKEALPLFEEAYQLSNRRPSTILALALCERELGRVADALAHLDEYLETTPSDREAYAAIRSELQAKVDAIEVKPPPPPPPPPPQIEPSPPPPAIAIPPPVIEETSGLTPLEIGLFASGGAAIVTGVVFAVLAARAESDVKSRIEDGRAPADVVSDRAERGFRFAVTADVLIVSGVVAAGAGFLVD